LHAEKTGTKFEELIVSSYGANATKWKEVSMSVCSTKEFVEERIWNAEDDNLERFGRTRVWLIVNLNRRSNGRAHDLLLSKQSILQI